MRTFGLVVALSVVASAFGSATYANADCVKEASEYSSSNSSATRDPLLSCLGIDVQKYSGVPCNEEAEIYTEEPTALFYNVLRVCLSKEKDHQVNTESNELEKIIRNFNDGLTSTSEEIFLKSQ